jgi:hypothetical protein
MYINQNESFWMSIIHSRTEVTEKNMPKFSIYNWPHPQKWPWLTKHGYNCKYNKNFKKSIMQYIGKNNEIILFFGPPTHRENPTQGYDPEC